MRLEKQNIPTSSRGKVNQRFRNFEADVDASKRKLTSLSSDRSALFGSRYTDEPDGSSDQHLEQRQQLLSGTDRLERSSQRIKNAHAMASETEQIGASTLADLGRQRETIQHTHEGLLESEGYVDRSVKTLRGMARRYCCPRATMLRKTRLTPRQDGYKSAYNHCHHHGVGHPHHCGHLEQVQVISFCSAFGMVVMRMRENTASFNKITDYSWLHVYRRTSCVSCNRTGIYSCQQACDHTLLGLCCFR